MDKKYPYGEVHWPRHGEKVSSRKKAGDRMPQHSADDDVAETAIIAGRLDLCFFRCFIRNEYE